MKYLLSPEDFIYLLDS